MNFAARICTRIPLKKGFLNAPMFTRHLGLGPIFDQPPAVSSVKIPLPKERENESLDQMKARLLYQSRKRGMLENDLLLSTFAHKYLDTFTPEMLRQYDRLINRPSNDWDIYYWATKIWDVPPEYSNEVMELLIEHCQNMNKENRTRQPDLH